MRRFRRTEADQQPTAMATVVECRYEFGAGQALAFGIPRSRHFRITFNYWAEGKLHTGEFFSSKAVPQGELFPITYNPAAPHENSKSTSVAVPSRLIGLVASVMVLAALATVFLAHGCTQAR